MALGPIVIDGVYSWAEYQLLRAELGKKLVVVAVFTPRMEGYRRLAARPDRPLSVEQAEERDLAEIENLQKGGTIAIADFTVMNSRSVEELRQSS